MEAFKTIIWIINIFASLAIIVLVLMQHGRGADAGASFGGSGSAQGVFGSAGNANFLSRMTGISAAVFFASCLALGYIHTNSNKKGLDFSTVQQHKSVESSPIPNMNDVVQASMTNTAASQTEKIENDDSAGISLGQAATAATAAAVTAKAVISNKNNDKKTDSEEVKDNKKTKKNTKKPESKKKTQSQNKKEKQQK